MNRILKWPMLGAIALLLFGAGSLFGADAAPASAPKMATAASVETVQINLNIVWTIVGGILVFAMQAGFALVETGFTRAKNAANIMMKNLMDFCTGSLAFFLIGSAFMFGKTAWGLIGTDGFFMNVFHEAAGWNWTFMFFQTMFCATAATIVSGAMAERTKFSSYLIYSIIVSAFIYPIAGKWAWGGLFGSGSAGWLESFGFCDFAGSTVVHFVGGSLALAGAIALGPRIGKFNADGSINAIPGHNLVIATLGVLVLWIGWFGFNPGSTTAGIGDIGRIALITNLGAVSGTVAALATAWILLGKPDLSMTLNGALAGLVAITAPCNTVTPIGAILIGAIGGALVILSVLALDKIHIDDPVGAVSVHAVNGLWGTIACGLFNAEAVLGTAAASTGLFYGGGFRQLGVQFMGAAAYFVWSFGLGMLLFLAMKHTIGLRVEEDEELKGLDLVEHGNDAYAGFQIFINE
ncbi:MAG: ammonium transporter [Victivallaceae bacterium]|nr:ammonium transporter [Victivallaceae bacterium]